MTCLIVRCPLEATIGRLCAAHHDYFERVLADPRYMTEPVPPSPRIEGNKVQGVLL